VFAAPQQAVSRVGWRTPGEKRLLPSNAARTVAHLDERRPVASVSRSRPLETARSGRRLFRTEFGRTRLFGWPMIRPSKVAFN
jgi:hypothetical protein